MATKSGFKTQWTIVQHSGYGYGEDPQFKRAVEVRSIDSKADANRVIKANGVLFDDYMEASDFEEKANGVTGELPFLHVAGYFSQKDIDGLRIYVPVRETTGSATERTVRIIA